MQRPRRPAPPFPAGATSPAVSLLAAPSFPSDASPSELSLREAFAREGWVCVRGCVSAEHVERLQRATDAMEAGAAQLEASERRDGMFFEACAPLSEPIAKPVGKPIEPAEPGNSRGGVSRPAERSERAPLR